MTMSMTSPNSSIITIATTRITTRARATTIVAVMVIHHIQTITIATIITTIVGPTSPTNLTNIKKITAGNKMKRTVGPSENITIIIKGAQRPTKATAQATTTIGVTTPAPKTNGKLFATGATSLVISPPIAPTKMEAVLTAE